MSRSVKITAKNKNRRTQNEWPVSLLAHLLLSLRLQGSDQIWATGSSPPMRTTVIEIVSYNIMTGWRDIRYKFVVVTASQNSAFNDKSVSFNHLVKQNHPS